MLCVVQLYAVINLCAFYRTSTPHLPTGLATYRENPHRWTHLLLQEFQFTAAAAANWFLS